jgi:hypothetical protein
MGHKVVFLIKHPVFHDEQGAGLDNDCKRQENLGW